MRSNKVIGILFLVGLIILAVFWFWQRQQPKKFGAIKVLIKQLSENDLKLQTIKVESTYPAKSFSNQQLTEYYQAKVLDKNDRVLYLTQIPKKYLISRFTYPDYPASDLINKPNTEIDLYLPIYPTSEKLVITDESENTIMSVSLENL